MTMKMIDCIESHHQPSRQVGLIAAHPAAASGHHRDHQLPPQQIHLNQPVVAAAQPFHRPQQQGADLVDVSATAAAAAAAAANSNELIGYYFGSISRETADWILRNHGNQMDGAYLLRSSGPNDDFVLSLLVVTTMSNLSSITCQQQPVPNGSLSGAPATSAAAVAVAPAAPISQHMQVLHYKIVETEDSFVALHGQVGDEKFATIDELIDKAQGVATKPRWPISRQSLESQILPPTYWGLSVYQVCLAFFIKAKQWGFPLLPSLFQPPSQASLLSSVAPGGEHNMPPEQPATQSNGTSVVTTLSIETMRTLIYKSLHEFQPWFHGKISRDEAERRIEDQDGFPLAPGKDGRFLVRERDNYSYAMCISHRRATKHYRIDVLPTGELAIQDGRKFTSLMALVSHYTIMSDGLWCALTEPCPRPIQPSPSSNSLDPASFATNNSQTTGRPTNCLQAYASPQNSQNLYCVPPPSQFSSNAASNPFGPATNLMNMNMMAPAAINSLSSASASSYHHGSAADNAGCASSASAKNSTSNTNGQLACVHPLSGGVHSLKAPIKEWLQTINQKWSQLMAAKSQRHESLNSFLFGSQNPLNNHCRHGRSRRHHNHNHHHHHHHHQNGERTRLSKHDAAPAACRCGRPQHLQQPAADEQRLATMSRNQLGPAGQTLNMNGRQSSRQTLACQPTAATATGGKFVPAASSLFMAAEPAFNRSLAYCLPPQNSGFQLNGQSFIGSPLFAVRPGGRVPSAKTAGPSSQAGSSGSGSGSGSHMAANQEEEKLISPAQSISANLNQQPAYGKCHAQMNQSDIYGSQPSTAIVNDDARHIRLAGGGGGGGSSSSTSSGATLNLHNNPNHQARINHQMGVAQSRFSCPPKQPQQYPSFDMQQQQLRQLQQAANFVTANRAQLPPPTQPLVQTGGPILCGQHAGPAYRYTNCQNDENSTFRACQHRQQQQPTSLTLTNNRPTAATAFNSARAFDDSQLHLESLSANQQSQLFGQAALSKFVQFQDGQCLRTHRDTRSIQMAYLSSQQHLQQRLQQQQMAKTSMRNNNSLAPRLTGTSSVQNGPPRNKGQTLGSQKCGSLVDQQATTDFDLMDCGGGISDFRVDPKLIKSCSIETLCGVGGDNDNCDFDYDADDDAELENVLQSCKSNAELLKACFKVNHHQPTDSFGHFGEPLKTAHADILKPIQMMSNEQPACENGASSIINHNDTKSGTNGDPGSQRHSELIGGKDNREKLDYLNKKHDLDELYTALFAELDASLKAQVDLKNKCLGFGNLSSQTHQVEQQQSGSSASSQQQDTSGQSNQKNPNELIYEFDSLISSNHNNSNSNSNSKEGQ